MLGSDQNQSLEIFGSQLCCFLDRCQNNKVKGASRRIPVKQNILQGYYLCGSNKQ